MKRILLIAPAALILNGCATMAVGIGCEWERSTSCPEEVLDVAMRLDGAVFGAALGAANGSRSPLKRVSVEGVVTSNGSPVYRARVDLSAGSELWTVRTDRRGRYRIYGVVEQGHCSDLHFTIRHPDQETAHRLPVECSDHQLDHDFPSPTTF